MLFNLFAVVRPPAPEAERELRSIHTSAELQRELSSEFDRQATNFLPADTAAVAYDAGYSPDQDEIMLIQPYEIPTWLQAARQAPDAVPSVSAPELEAGLVRAVVAVRNLSRGRDEFLFQSFDGRQVLRATNRYLFLAGGHFDRLERTGIQIADHLTAIVRARDLYFRSEYIVRRYLDLDDYFREATDGELASFLDGALWDVPDRATVMQVADRWTRRRVTSILQDSILEGLAPRKLRDLAKHYDIHVDIVRRQGKERITMPTERGQIKMLLRLLSEDLYDAPLSGERYLANSKRKLA